MHDLPKVTQGPRRDVNPFPRLCCWTTVFLPSDLHPVPGPPGLALVGTPPPRWPSEVLVLAPGPEL